MLKWMLHVQLIVFLLIPNALASSFLNCDEDLGEVLSPLETLKVRLEATTLRDQGIRELTNFHRDLTFHAVRAAYARKRIEQLNSQSSLFFNLNLVLDNPDDHSWYVPRDLQDVEGFGEEGDLQFQLTLLQSLFPAGLDCFAPHIPLFYLKLSESRDFSDYMGHQRLFARMQNLIEGIIHVSGRPYFNDLLGDLLQEFVEGGQKCADNAVLRLETCDHLVRLGSFMGEAHEAGAQERGLFSLLLNAFKLHVLDEIVDHRVAESNEEALYLRLMFNVSLSLRQPVGYVTHHEIAQKRPLGGLLEQFFGRMDMEHFVHFVLNYKIGGAGVWDQYLALHCESYKAKRDFSAAEMIENDLRSQIAFENLQQEQYVRLLQMLIYQGYVLTAADYVLPENM